jgi:hypothetical protein
MIFHWASVSVVRIKVASYLATLNHLAADLGILKRQQALVEQLTGSESIDSRRTENYFLKAELNSEVTEVETLRIKGTS